MSEGKSCPYCGGTGKARALAIMYEDGKAVRGVKVIRPCTRCGAGLRLHGVPGARCRWIVRGPKGTVSRCPVCGATTTGEAEPIVPPIEEWPPGPRLLTMMEDILLPGQYVQLRDGQPVPPERPQEARRAAGSWKTCPPLRGAPTAAQGPHGGAREVEAGTAPPAPPPAPTPKLPLEGLDDEDPDVEVPF